ncbi:hypothetical protein [Edaphobacter modestus]|uniref:TrbI/VirB10 family protein n=1 Tax=Edaphobacter modestus TaxID=388466 RepID=A0A4Q7YP35_9BACT|nr:hypothetical protein [Edaphobacter modestus]RZU39522.1 hypothetical protein BDD14_0907 [Edaphobacter modestus]
MKIRMIPAAALVVATLPLAAQTGRTGVSNPEPVTIDADNGDAAASSAKSETETTRRPLTQAKPSAAKPETAGETYGPYVPYKNAAVAQTAAPAAAVDVDAQIVTSVPEREGEINEGTLLHVRMREQLSTATTEPGAKFTAEVMEAITNHGRVIIPIGSVLEGHVTAVHAGRRISGVASLHLEPEHVTLPDGTVYPIHAQLIDTTLGNFNVDREGTLKRRDRAKETLAVAALATGGGAVAGAMLGGGVGAVVGAGVGAGVSTVMWLKQERQATLDQGSRLVFSMTMPLTLKQVDAAQGTAMNTDAGTALRAASE